MFVDRHQKNSSRPREGYDCHFGWMHGGGVGKSLLILVYMYFFLFFFLKNKYVFIYLVCPSASAGRGTKGKSGITSRLILFCCMLVSGVYIYCCKNIFYAGWGENRSMNILQCRSKFTLKIVYFMNSKGIGRSEMNNYPSCQYQYILQTTVLWDHTIY